ncbi:OmpA family protein [Elizabethkingia anophelis]|uniref:OmpA family protein n=1 Tax=Elizabethkingia anophelis TaxID=1117645 RepID=UPI0021A4CB0F|nr:OmpA family protein [Elizabethkingia anophelis]
MKLTFTSVFFSLTLPLSIYAQKSDSQNAHLKNQYPVEYNSGSNDISLFTNRSKRFNDWSVSAGAGTAIMQRGSLYSINDDSGSKNLFGWTAYFSVDKAITHAFGLKFQYDKGETRQGWVNTKDKVSSNSPGGRTQYDGLSVLGVLNLTSLVRRTDNQIPYRWGLHLYAGLGLLAFRSYMQEPGPYNETLTTEIKPFKLKSVYAQVGTGLKYRLNRSFDLEGRMMYSLVGAKGFDGARGKYIDPSREGSSGMLNATLGLTYTIGKHPSHLFWSDPLQGINYKINVIENKGQDVVVCKKGDVDNDGVCDDWDRELNTPAGARVDGSGRALDTDLDGVIDLYDKCVTVSGPVSNQGCPVEKDNHKAALQIEKQLENVYFEFNKALITKESETGLNAAARIIKDTDGRYLITGYTDAKGSSAANLKLSRERASAVVDALEARGVSPDVLKSRGVGSSQAVFSVNASDEERASDRKVTVRFVEDSEWNRIPKKDFNDAFSIKNRIKKHN